MRHLHGRNADRERQGDGGISPPGECRDMSGSGRAASCVRHGESRNGETSGKGSNISQTESPNWSDGMNKPRLLRKITLPK